jgi:hypothetical protein
MLPYPRLCSIHPPGLEQMTSSAHIFFDYLKKSYPHQLPYLNNVFSNYFSKYVGLTDNTAKNPKWGHWS